MFKQLANVIEWENPLGDQIFYKWGNSEIKKGSKVFIRPGQDAIFYKSGKIEGIFEDEGEYDVQSEIIPFLSTLKGFKFGFKSGMLCEVLFVNTKEIIIPWGTASPVNIPCASMPGGMPIRANGTLAFKVDDYNIMIEKLAGTSGSYGVADVKKRVMANLSPLLMKWISTVGKDMFNLQANAIEIGNGIKGDLDMMLVPDGITVTQFSVASFNYPAEIQAMITKNASHGMISDVNKYTAVAMADNIGKGGGSSTATGFAEMMMGAKLAGDMFGNMNSGMAQPQQQQPQPQAQASVPTSAPAGGYKFCPECGSKAEGSKFCGNCGFKLD